MARGWESKSVESQMESAADKPNVTRGVMTPEQTAKHHQRESLRLALARVKQQIESATDPRYVKLLNDTLQDLEARIAQLR